jgi:hypothetical protein
VRGTNAGGRTRLTEGEEHSQPALLEVVVLYSGGCEALGDPDAGAFEGVVEAVPATGALLSTRRAATCSFSWVTAPDHSTSCCLYWPSALDICIS